MLTPIITDILLLSLLLLVIWVLVKTSSKSTGAETFTKLDTRLDEYLRRINQLEQQIGNVQLEQLNTLSTLREGLVGAFSELREELRVILSAHDTRFERRQGEALKHLTDSLQSGMTNTQRLVGENLSRYSEDLGNRVADLTRKTDQRLQEISGQVEKKLSEGFEKTNATFADILTRLKLIDEAQKKITELSSNVVSLQEILADKRSRGTFGEVQLKSLIQNVIPAAHYKMQYTLPNDKIADCVLFLPEPTGMIAIDSKFPLESYQRMTDHDVSEAERREAQRQFKTGIQKHITDISTKYIIPGTTSDGAMMFIPAESIFSEIQSHHPDVVEKAHRAKVWIVSPTTMWAILNTARTVLKDAATREQVHIIQEHLGYLGKDFERFQKRMDDLSRHIKQAHDDVENVNKSAKKISSRFSKIEQVELENEEGRPLKVIDIDDKKKIT